MKFGLDVLCVVPKGEFPQFSGNPYRPFPQEGKLPKNFHISWMSSWARFQPFSKSHKKTLLIGFRNAVSFYVEITVRAIKWFHKNTNTIKCDRMAESSSVGVFWVVFISLEGRRPLSQSLNKEGSMVLFIPLQVIQEDKSVLELYVI